MNQLVRKNQKSGTAKAAERRRILIVHLDDGRGRPLCGLPSPFPSEAHSVGIPPTRQDVCLTCDSVSKPH